MSFKTGNEKKYQIADNFKNIIANKNVACALANIDGNMIYEIRKECSKFNIDVISIKNSIATKILFPNKDREIKGAHLFFASDEIFKLNDILKSYFKYKLISIEFIINDKVIVEGWNTNYRSNQDVLITLIRTLQAPIINFIKVQKIIAKKFAS